MATAAELQEAQRLAEEALRQRIPERRYGAGYDVAAYQQQILQNQSLAQQNINAIAQGQQQIAEVQQSNQAMEQRQALLDAIDSSISRSLRKYGGGVYASNYARQVAEYFAQLGLGYRNGLEYYRNSIDRFSDYQERRSALQQAQKSIDQFQKANPNEKIIFGNDGQVVGVQSTVLGQSRVLKTPAQLESYNAALAVAQGNKLTAPQSLNPTTQKLVDTIQARQQSQDLRTLNNPQSRPTQFSTQPQQSLANAYNAVTEYAGAGIYGTGGVGEIIASSFGYDPFRKQSEDLTKLQEQQNSRVESFNRLSKSGKLSQEEADQQLSFLESNQRIIDQKAANLEEERRASRVGRFEKSSADFGQGIRDFAPNALAEVEAVTKLFESVRESNAPRTVKGAAKVGEFLYGLPAGYLAEVTERPLQLAVMAGVTLGAGLAVKSVKIGARAVRIVRTGEELKATAPTLKNIITVNKIPIVQVSDASLIQLSKASLGIALAVPIATQITAAQSPTEAGQFLGRGLAFGSAAGFGFASGQAALTPIERFIFEPYKITKVTPAAVVQQTEFLQTYRDELRDLSVGQFRVKARQNPTTIYSFSRFDELILNINAKRNKFAVRESAGGSVVADLYYNPADILEGFAKRKREGVVLPETASVGVSQSKPVVVIRGKLFDAEAYFNEGRLQPAKFRTATQGRNFKQYLQTLEGGIEDQNIAEGIIGRRNTERLKKALAERRSATGVVSDANVDLIVKDADIFGAMKQTRVAQVLRSGRVKDITARDRVSTFTLRSYAKEIPLKNQDFLAFEGDTAFFDTTLPTSRPRKIPTVRSRTFFKESNLKDEIDALNSPIPEARTPRVRTVQQQTTIQIVDQAGAAIARGTTRKVTVPSDAALRNRFAPLSTPAKATTGAFAGLALYEKTVGGALPREVSAQFSLPQERSVLRTPQLAIPKETTREVTRNIPREIAREITQTIPREIVREVTRVVPRVVPREVPREVVRENPFPRSPPRAPPSPRPRPFTLPRLTQRRPSDDTIKDYIVEQRRRGTFRVVGKSKTAQGAFDLGQEITKENLGATFRVRGVKGTDRFNIDLGTFRRPSSKREAPFTFIQRRGTRLSSRGERDEIQLARQIKGFK